MGESIPDDWLAAIGDRLSLDDFQRLSELADREFDAGLHVYPPVGKRYEALRRTPFACVRAEILGQDPYHECNQAHGLAFSSRDAKRSRSLQNILDEWHDDCGSISLRATRWRLGRITGCSF